MSREPLQSGPSRWSGYLVASILWTALIFWIVCQPVAAYRKSAQQSQQPGLYDLTGWNGASKWYDQDAKVNVATAIDIDGEIGHPLSVRSPGANCVPGGHWSALSRINSAALPPGLTLDSRSNISGIPTERGHWIVEIELYDLQCNDQPYAGLKQELRFQITGSGRVVQ